MPLGRYFHNLPTLISLDIQRDSGKNPQVLQLHVCPLVLCPSARGTGTCELSFFINCRLHWHFRFGPSNLKASWGPRANPGKVCPFWSSTCLFAQLHKLLTYKSYSQSVRVIQLLKLSWEGLSQTKQRTLALQRKGAGEGRKQVKNLGATRAVVQSEWLNSFCLFNQSFHIKSKEHLYLLQIWVSWQTDLIRPRFLPDVKWHAVQAGLAYQMDEIAWGAFQLPPPPSFLILGRNGGARYCIWVPGMKATLSLWRQLLQAQSAIELTGDITIQLCSAVQSSGREHRFWIGFCHVPVRQPSENDFIPASLSFVIPKMGQILVHTS